MPGYSDGCQALNEKKCLPMYNGKSICNKVDSGPYIVQIYCLKTNEWKRIVDFKYDMQLLDQYMLI